VSGGAAVSRRYVHGHVALPASFVALAMDRNINKRLPRGVLQCLSELCVSWVLINGHVYGLQCQKDVRDMKCGHGRDNALKIVTRMGKFNLSFVCPVITYMYIFTNTCMCAVALGFWHIPFQTNYNMKQGVRLWQNHGLLEKSTEFAVFPTSQKPRLFHSLYLISILHSIQRTASVV
jgi:hypothetical protein